MDGFQVHALDPGRPTQWPWMSVAYSLQLLADSCLLPLGPITPLSTEHFGNRFWTDMASFNSSLCSEKYGLEVVRMHCHTCR